MITRLAHTSVIKRTIDQAHDSGEAGQEKKGLAPESIQDVLDAILACIRPTSAVEFVPVRCANGRVLANTMFSFLGNRPLL